MRRLTGTAKISLPTLAEFTFATFYEDWVSVRVRFDVGRSRTCGVERDNMITNSNVRDALANRFDLQGKRELH